MKFNYLPFFRRNLNNRQPLCRANMRLSAGSEVPISWFLYSPPALNQGFGHLPADKIFSDEL